MRVESSHSANFKMTPILTDTRDSICCGATINELELCSECLEHTEAIDYDAEDVSFTPSYGEIATVAFIVIAMFVFGIGLNVIEGVR